MVNDATVRKWRKKLREYGDRALIASTGGGRPKQLTTEQEQRLGALIDAGAKSYGFPNEQWTSPRVREVIGQQFGVWYHVDHVYKLLIKLGFSVQKPDKRAVERNEESIQTWIRTRGVELGEKIEQGTTVVFLDESGFSLKTTAARTWARKGQTPVVPTKLRWTHLSVIGAITSSGKFLQHTHVGAIKAPQVVAFLEHVLDHVPGTIVVVLDQAMIHRAKCVSELVEQHPRLSLEYLPGYAPELNPIEWLWAYVKKNVFGNFCAKSVADLKERLRYAWQRLRRNQLVPSFFAACAFALPCTT
ncbi:transposase [Deinococcus peraridilitoris DSM 19664]|uniref:Transposase n=1 Tax=Deinococcus peraridilitoris (strain DSM 19664 / LMG 22246 / CIP 109416 / KR-200) TaxID=937777 RepID=L0A3X4_DEIPD|nr:transposase [Deinococcus peraridilitoris DSM 19664]